ncbi:MAG: PAS domain S-box protein [Gemmataceae bacterium]
MRTLLRSSLGRAIWLSLGPMFAVGSVVLLVDGVRLRHLIKERERVHPFYLEVADSVLELDEGLAARTRDAGDRAAAARWAERRDKVRENVSEFAAVADAAPDLPIAACAAYVERKVDAAGATYAQIISSAVSPVDRLRLEADFTSAITDALGELRRFYPPLRGSLDELSRRLDVRNNFLTAAVLLACAFALASTVNGTILARWADRHERAEAKARRKQQFIEAVVGAIPQVLFVYDLLANRYVFGNARLTKVLGYTNDDAKRLGSDLLAQLIHPDDKARLQAHFFRCAISQPGEVLELEYRGRHADGTWRWLRSRDLIFERTADGRAKLLLGAADDITEQKRAAHELAAAHRRLKAILDAATHVSVIATDRHGTITTFNVGAERLLGYAAAEMVGTKKQDRLHVPSEIAERRRP